jgi:quinol monooxygenase YgiN
MVSIYAFFKINAGKEAEAEAALKEMADAVDKNEPDCVLYAIHRGKEDPLEVHFFEIYKDAAAAAAHSGSEHMGNFRQYFREVFDPSTVKIVQLERVAAAVH